AVNSRSNWGVSGQVDYDLTHALTLTAGARYDTDSRRQLNLLNAQVRTAKFSAVQPKLSAAYRFSPDKLIYATWGVGFRSGGFNLFARMGLSDPKITRFAADPSVVGNVLPRGYKATYNAGFDYSHRVGPQTNFFVRADVQHYSRKYWFVDNLDVQQAKTYVNG